MINIPDLIKKKPTIKNIFAAVGIFLCALLLRLPYLSYPKTTVGDEVMYETFTLNTLYGIPFFEIHPPLSRLVFATIVAPSHPSLQKVLWGTDKPFGDFPYQNIRRFNAVLGSLLPVIIFFIGLVLGYSLKEALFPAALIIIDGMFIQYSRLMFPDMILWVTGFFGILLLLFGLKCRKNPQRWFFVLSSGILFGLATSVKWTGLGFLLVAGFALLSKKALRFFAPIAFIAFVTYALVFTIFVFKIGGGHIQAERTYYPKFDYVQELAFPENKTPSKIARFFVDYHHVAFMMNNDPRFRKITTPRGNPYQWPLALTSFSWSKHDGKFIIVFGNPVSWRLAFLAILVMVFITLREITDKREKLTEYESFLLAGYLLNYIPFLFIMFSRPMFIYHYGVSIIFAFLLIPAFFARAKIRYSHQQIFWRVSYAVALIIIAIAIISSPFIYGF